MSRVRDCVCCHCVSDRHRGRLKEVWLCRSFPTSGPVCESGDYLALDRSLPVPEPGDLLAVMSAGACGAVQAGTYNSRAPMPKLLPEVLVRTDEWALVRPRLSVEDLIALDRLPPWL